MYTDCRGETYVYACCIVGRARICGQIFSLAMGFAKRGLQVCIGKWEKALYTGLHGVRQIFL